MYFCAEMKYELSILIPVFNDVCTTTVRILCAQAAAIEGLSYEIIVADDGSNDNDCIEANSPIAKLPHCQYIIREKNVGRASIRNFLAKQARYEWLLFIDGDMSIVTPNFISNYLESDAQEVIYGGYKVGKGDVRNLRYVYEKSCESSHTVEERRKQPYKDFHTSNFMIRRKLMMEHRFDERFRQYGYEDVLFGKRLRQNSIGIQHIDNPVGFETFEDNVLFVEKTEEGLRTLHTFKDDLRGYIYLLTFVNGIHLNIMRSVIRLWHKMFGSLERSYLTGNNPNLTLFKIYKLGYYLTLTKND